MEANVKENSKLTSLISPATEQFVREAWKAQINAPWDFIHSCVYARWPYLYISIGRQDHPFSRFLKPILQVWQKIQPNRKPQNVVSPSPDQATGTIADLYHGKALPLNQAQDLVMVNEPINLPDLEQVIPYVQARAIIQQNPDHILLVKCPCRMSKKDPCLPLDVCMVIGEPFAELVFQHYPSRARWITQEEACHILDREDARGRVHHAFFSQMMLGRFFGICNCCSCCCSAISAQRKGTPMLASSGYVAQIDQGICIACNECEVYCQFGALQMINGSKAVDDELCMGCGVCVSKCAQSAISLRLEPSKGVPLQINHLLEEARQYN
jgi:Pyruvate/2-oxoacid:ferredoxin oxidoreductase delta subunit